MAPAYPERLSSAGRVGALAVAAIVLAGLVTVSHLVPAESGIGTHEQLGLRPCDFLRRTGLPCPTCGMTTAAALLVQGRPVRAVMTQPLGALLTVAAGVAFWACLYAGISGRPVHRMLGRISAVRSAATVSLVAVCAWGWKILVHLGVVRI